MESIFDDTSIRKSAKFIIELRYYRRDESFLSDSTSDDNSVYRFMNEDDVSKPCPTNYDAKNE